MSYTIDISPSPIPPLHPSIGSFLSDFYRVSDSPDAHDDYVNFFTQDASFVMASKQARGHDEILPIRKGMWDAVASRHHEVSAVFPAQSNVTSSSACELMLRGRVTYGFRKGGEASKQWGGYARLVSGADGGWKFAEYQVYLDTGS